MKIRKLHIKNYKVFNDLELDFTDANGNTLDTIVLAGVNGCGKTTILEIIRSIYDDSLSRNLRNLNDSSIEIEIEVTSIEKENYQKATLNAESSLKGRNLSEEHSFFKQM